MELILKLEKIILVRNSPFSGKPQSSEVAHWNVSHDYESKPFIGIDLIGLGCPKQVDKCTPLICHQEISSSA